MAILWNFTFVRSTSRTYLNDSAFLNELFLGNEKLNKLLTKLPNQRKAETGFVSICVLIPLRSA